MGGGGKGHGCADDLLLEDEEKSDDDINIANTSYSEKITAVVTRERGITLF